LAEAQAGGDALTQVVTAAVQRVLETHNNDVQEVLRYTWQGQMPPPCKQSVTAYRQFQQSGIVEVVHEYCWWGSNGLSHPFVERRANELTAEERSMQTASVSPAAAVTPADGLLVHVPSGLRPSPFPRIFSRDGTLLHGVSTVDRSLLLDVGLASFAKSDPEGRAKLADRGVRSPLAVVGYLRGTSELVLDPEDVTKVLTSDRVTHLLRQARVCVVFIE
jgi:hypothetical protein